MNVLLAVASCSAVAILVSASTISTPHGCRRTCLPWEEEEPKTCWYNFTIEWYRTLSKACYNCPFNETDCFRKECVSGDGVIKPLITVNRQVPGYSIEVCEGDTVVVWVYNDMEDGLSTSIHWHGIGQKGSPYFDGVGGITQCNIGSKQQFRYEFVASPAGTHWYHAHTGMQLADGLFGPIIVGQPAYLDPSSDLYDVDDHIIMVGDWLPGASMARYVDLMHGPYTETLTTQGLHINGRGRNVDVPNRFKVVNESLSSAKTPLEVFEVTSDKRYRFRVIQTSASCPVHIAVENHKLLIIAVDGSPVKPRPVDVVILSPGERCDFVLIADQDVANYWIKVIGLGDCLTTNVTAGAILRYQHAPNEEPTTDMMFSTVNMTMLNPVPLNSDAMKDVYGKDHVLIYPTDLEYAVSEINLASQQVDKRLYITLGYGINWNLYNREDPPPGRPHHTPVLDNIAFVLPPTPLLSQPQDVIESWFCNQSTIGDDKMCPAGLCLCTHVLQLNVDEIVEIILINSPKMSNDAGHPMHLHGHKFYLLGQGQLQKGITREEIMQLDKEGKLSRNFINPPLRDTITIHDGVYTIIRFKADNPGFWLLDCNKGTDLAQGQALLLKIGDYNDFPPIPNRFPQCGGWGSKVSDRKPKPCPKPNISAAMNISVTFVLMAFVVTFLFSIRDCTLH